MKKKVFFLAVLALSWLCGKAVAEDVLMPQFGHQTITVSAGSPVTFYDMKSNTGISSSSSNNSFATTIFQPAEEGNSIKIVFESLDVRNDGTSWPAYVKVYNGVFDVSSVTYPTSTSGVTTAEFPTTDKQLAKLDGTYSNLEYVSGDATGALSVCYHYKYAKAIDGWKATVSSITLEAMEVESAEGDNSFVDGSVWAGKANVAVAGFHITTTGYSSPDKLQSFTFTCSNSDVVDPTALKFYAGSAASVAGLTEIAGTMAEADGVYTFTLTDAQALGNGANKFCLGGDILATAPFNATAAVNVTGLTTVGGYTTFVAADAVALTVQPMYLMAENATYAIGGETNFYDEGGPEGKVVKGFNGKVVFEPAHEGQKVKLTFKSIEVFYTDYAASSTGYVDIIKVYNGNSTDADDLLWELTQAQASSSSDIVLKSTAEDGKLTIIHQCNVSYDSNLKDGWSAVVEEFTPQAMTVESVELTKSSGSVSAGTVGLEVACFKVVTAETEPALKLNSLSFNTNNTAAQIKNARLYYTKDNAFATTTKLGEAVVEDNAVLLTPDNEVYFREGENYLWVAYEIESLAQNGDKVDFVATKLAFSNETEHTDFGEQTGDFTIENVAIQKCGEQRITVSGEWQYTHTVASEYSTKYKGEDCDQMITFVPATAGNVIQIDYTDFDVYYATSSYSTRAKYIVYDGEGTSGTKLWELDANGKQPTQIRANGAVTIVFNPNTTSSYYTGNGWHATVTEYTLQPMMVKSYAVAQASTQLVKLGEEKAALLSLTVNTEGTLNPLMVYAVTVDLKGTESNIDKVYWLDAEGNELASADAAETVTLMNTEGVALAEYANNFSIAVDVKATATIDETIDAKLTGVKVGEYTLPVSAEIGDPEGAREIKNVMNMAAGDNGVVTIGANSLMFYDDGGIDGNYSSYFEGYVTFMPTTAGCAIELVFKAFDVAYLYGGDPFSIYYSNEYDSSAEPDKTYGMYSLPAENESVISKADDGAITVYVKMPSSQKAGFEVEVREHLLTNLAVDSMVVTSLAPAEATKGSSDLRLLQAAVYVSGDRNPLTVTEFENVTSDLLTDLNIYATGHSTTFATTTPFTDSYVLDEMGVYYFWFLGSISTEAEEGDVVSLQLLNLVCGAEKTAPQNEATATVNVVSGAHGEYLIGSSEFADYPTLTAALAAIQAIGMDGAVTLNIEAGTYTEQVTVPEITGAGAANTLTICSESGNFDDVVFQYNTSLTSEQGVFTIAGADYVTVRGISFTSTYTSNQNPAIVVVNNASTHVTIDNCYIHATKLTEYSVQLNLLFLDAGANNFNNDFTLVNSVLEGGYMGLKVTGHKAAADALQQNMRIQSNNFRDQGNQMIYGDAVDGLQILDNTFRNEAKSGNAKAIDWLLVGGTALIQGNDILYTGLASDSRSINAICLRPNSYQDKNATWQVINNVVNVQNASSYASYCINFSTNMCKLLVAHNTMVLASEGTSSSPFYIEAAPTEGSRFVNNIFQSTSKGYAVRYKNASCINSNIAYEHNVIYTADATFGMPTANVSTYEDWMTAVSTTAEQGNLNEPAVFASANLLIPSEEGNLLTAAVLDFVTTDITGKQRSATPTIGAYEYDADLFRVPVMAEGYPKANAQDVTANIVIKADNLGSAKILVQAADAEAPSMDELSASENEIGLAADAEVAFKAEGLTEETEYKAYILLVSPLGTQATTMQEIAFTTAWTLRPVELEAIAAQSVAENTEVTLTAALVNEYEQAQPYSYKWYTAFSEEALSDEATLSVTPLGSTEYICKVTDKFGQKALVSAHVRVLKDAPAMATFEEYDLESGAHKMVDDAWTDNVETVLYSGSYAFANVPNKAYNAYTGFVISADELTEYTGNYMIDQFRSAAGGAYDGTNFAVAYYSAPSSYYAGYKDPIRFTNSAEAQTITGCYITNSAYTYDNIINGDYDNDPFEEGDYLLLTVHGYNGDTPTGDVQFYLADFRSSDETEHFVLNEWKWLDLSSLGAVTDLDFDMFSTKSNDWGFTTATYFCIDNFGGAAPEAPTEMEKITNDQSQTTNKVLRDGQLYILRGGKVYTIHGAEVR